VWIVSENVLLSSKEGTLSFQPAALEVSGNCIVAVRPLTSDDAFWQTKRATQHVVDYGKRLITPAFVNAHTHLALGFLRGAPLLNKDNLVEDLFFHYESKLSAEDVRAFTRMGAYESLLSGVGMVWDHYYFGESVAQALADVNLCGVVAPTLQDLAGPGIAQCEAQLLATESIAHSMKYAERGIYAALGPHATDTVSAVLWSKAIELAQTYQLPVHAHVAQSFEEYQRVVQREGCSPVLWLERLGVLAQAARMLLVHMLYASQADLARLSSARHAVGFCPYSQVVFGFAAQPAYWGEVPWFVGTDCTPSNDSMNLQKELKVVRGQPLFSICDSPSYEVFHKTATLEAATCVDRERRYAQRKQSAYNAHELLPRIWSIPGKLHPSFVAGALEQGALANILVWDERHPSLWPAHDPWSALAFGDALMAIEAMYVAGKPIATAGLSSIRQSPEYRDAEQEASRRLALLCG